MAIGTAGEPGQRPVTADAEVVALQLGRPPRGLRRVAHRCPCGLPDVVETAPRLADGTPFPTLYYLTCPRATAAVGRLEAAGVMRQMQQRLATDPELRAAYQAAHRDYLARRDEAARAAGVAAAAAWHAERGRHARPGQVPARAHRPRACRAGGQPAGPGGRGAGGAVVAGGPVRLRRGRRARVNGGAVVRVAAIDCGTNSVRLLVADVDRAAGRLSDVDRRLEIVRLGQGVDATGRLGAEPLARTLRVLRSYRQIIAAGVGVSRAHGGHQRHQGRGQRGRVRRGVRDILAIEPEVLSGEDEARLSFTGATAELAGDAAAPYLVTDIGGGSTEFVLGEPGAVTAAVSVNIGCVRMTERHLRHDPPGDDEIAAARADIDAALDVVAGKIPVSARAHPGRPGRFGDHRGRAGARAGQLSARADPSLPGQRGSGAGGGRKPAGADPGGAGTAGRDAPGPGGRDRRRRAGARPRSWSGSASMRCW